MPLITTGTLGTIQVYLQTISVVVMIVIHNSPQAFQTAFSPLPPTPWVLRPFFALLPGEREQLLGRHLALDVRLDEDRRASTRSRKVQKSEYTDGMIDFP